MHSLPRKRPSKLAAATWTPIPASAKPPKEDAETPPADSKTPQAATKAPDPRIAKITDQVKSLTARLAKADPKANFAVGATLKISQAAAAHRGGNLDQAEKLLKEADTLLNFLDSKK